MNVDERKALAKDIGGAFDHPDLNATERALAEDIIAKLVQDEIASVRAAIASSVAGHTGRRS